MVIRVHNPFPLLPQHACAPVSPARPEVVASRLGPVTERSQARNTRTEEGTTPPPESRRHDPAD